jgi:hypothetical protein
VRGRDLGGAVLEAQQKIDKQVSLPPGSRLEWVGEFGDLQAAMARLEVVVPISLALIMLLLFLNFGSLTDMALAASVMPMALVGGVLILAFTGTAFSVSAAIGFIGLFGISVMEGILVLAYFNQLLGSGMARSEAVLHAARTRFRPVMMTCIAACVGLLPAALSSGIGSRCSAAGAGGGGRHSAGPGADPDRAAGDDRPLLQAPAPRGTTSGGCGMKRASLGLMLLLGGCAVGPDFHQPAAPKQQAYTPEPITRWPRPRVSPVARSKCMTARPRRIGGACSDRSSSMR